MNTLFRKFLFYNILGLGLIAVIVLATLQLSQNNLVDKRIQQIKNQSELVQKHIQKIKENGITIHHRKTFEPIKSLIHNK